MASFFQCFCKDGYKGDGYNECRNVNECYRDTTLCSEPKMKCLDTEGSYECVCADGFKENDKVEFIDSKTN